MAQIKETLNLTIGGKSIEVNHEGIKKLEDQKDGLQAVDRVIEREIKEGKTSGFIPYNNFECSVDWKVTE